MAAREIRDFPEMHSFPCLSGSGRTVFGPCSCQVSKHSPCLLFQLLGQSHSFHKGAVIDELPSPLDLKDTPFRAV